MGKKEIMALAVVRVSNGYVCSCVMYIVQYARRTSCFSLGLGLAVSIFQFWIVYHTVAQERDVALAVVRVSSGYVAVV